MECGLRKEINPVDDYAGMNIKELFLKAIEEAVKSVSDKEIQDIIDRLVTLGDIYPASLDEVRHVLEREKRKKEIYESTSND